MEHSAIGARLGSASSTSCVSRWVSTPTTSRCWGWTRRAGAPQAGPGPLPATRLGHHPRRRVRRDDGRSGAGRRPTLTLADRLLATVLHHRLALPQVAVAALFSVRPETINRRIRDTRDLLDQAGHTIEPTQQPLATLDDLYDLARTASITTPTRTTTAS